MRLRVINPTITSRWAEESRQAYAVAAGPDTEVSIDTIEFGTPSIESRRDVALVTPGIVQAAIRAEQEGCHAVAVDCMLDPGVHAAREVVSIPVLGPAEAAMHLGATLGFRFSVISVSDDRRALVQERARRYGLSERLASVRSLGIPVLELDDDPERTLAVAIDRAREAVQLDRADVVIPGCTGLAGKAHLIQGALASEGIDITVVDPPSAATRTLEATVQMGLGPSRRTYPARSPKAGRWPGVSEERVS